MNLGGYIALFALALIWGLSYPLVSIVLNTITSTELLAIRFIISAIILLPIIKYNYLNFASLELALWIGLSYLTQTISLETINPASSAFISALYVLFVPLIIFLTQSKNINTLIPGIIALIAITVTVGLPNQWENDVWIALIMPITFSVYIIRITYYLNKYSAMGLANGQNIFLGLLSLPFVHTINLEDIDWILLCILVIITILAPILQNIGQETVSKSNAALILAMEPIFAAIFTFQYTWNLFLTSIIFLFAIWLNNVIEKNNQTSFEST